MPWRGCRPCHKLSCSTCRVQVFVDGVKLAIDYSAASCTTLRYDSRSGTVGCTNAQATIVFKARCGNPSVAEASVVTLASQLSAVQLCRPTGPKLGDRRGSNAVTCSRQCQEQRAACALQVLFQQVPVLAFKFCALSYDLRWARAVLMCSGSGKHVPLHRSESKDCAR